MNIVTLIAFFKHPLNADKQKTYIYRNFHSINKKIFDFAYDIKFHIFRFTKQKKLIALYYDFNNSIKDIINFDEEISPEDKNFDPLKIFNENPTLRYLNIFFTNISKKQFPERRSIIADTIIFFNSVEYPFYLNIENKTVSYQWLKKTIYFLYLFENRNLDEIYKYLTANFNIRILFCYAGQSSTNNSNYLAARFGSKQKINGTMIDFLNKKNIFAHKKIDIFWINLDSEFERRKAMNAFFVAMNIKATRISAINGKNIARRFGVKFLESSTEIGCFLSHIKAIRKFNKKSSKSDEYALILEDDISLDNQFFVNETLEEIEKNAPADWEILVLGYSNRRRLYHRYEPWDGALSGAFSYLIKKSAAERLLGHFKVDNIFKKRIKREYISDIYLYSKLKTYFYCNKIFITEAFQSTISETHYDSHLASRSIEFNHD